MVVGPRRPGVHVGLAAPVEDVVDKSTPKIGPTGTGRVHRPRVSDNQTLYVLGPRGSYGLESV